MGEEQIDIEPKAQSNDIQTKRKKPTPTYKTPSKNIQESSHKDAKTAQKANQGRIKHIVEHKPSEGQTSTPS